MDYKIGDTHISAHGIGDKDQHVVDAHAQIVMEHIRTHSKIRFGLYALAALFVCVASVLVVFAPDGRETATYFVAIALIVVAVGAAGFASFKLKAPMVEIAGK